MRTVAMPGGPARSLLREWERIGGRLSAMWHYASRSKSPRLEVSGPLNELIEALAPLGMPDARCASRRSHGGWVMPICAATYLVRLRPIVINLAVVMIFHLAAIRYVFLPIGNPCAAGTSLSNVADVYGLLARPGDFPGVNDARTKFSFSDPLARAC